MVEIGIRWCNRDQHQAQGEERGKHNANCGVFPHAAAATYPTDEGYRHEGGDDRANSEGDTHNIGEHHAG